MRGETGWAVGVSHVTQEAVRCQVEADCEYSQVSVRNPSIFTKTFIF